MGDVGLPELVAALGGELIGTTPCAEPVRIERIGAFEGASPTTITFLSSARLRPQLAASRAGCVIVAPDLAQEAARRGPAIVTDDPYLYYARLTQWWGKRVRPRLPVGVHASAVVDPSAQIGANVSIGPLAVVEAGAVLADGVVIGAQSYVGRDARIGPGTRVAAQVMFGERCVIGARGVLNSGVVIGGDGFGFAPSQGRWEKIEQFGAVRIGDDVDIGANTCIDRGAIDDTVIGDGVKLDNLIQIGHNVRIGDHTAMAGCVGVAGSAVIGKYVMIGGAAMIGGHLELVDHVNISAGTLVARSIRKPGVYTGVFPVDDNASWEKNAATLRQLYSLRDRLRTLEKAATEKNNPDSA